ncbi:MAG TPA: DUF1302 domain-containing protein [Usitatibacter sp.]|nr:DUF1302 domain-containing protein [Usitatibacter sp.]
MKVSRPALKPLALAIALAAAPAYAVQFELDNGVKGSVDTTISYGVSVRTEAPEPSSIGIANGGTSRSVNDDDGDLNFKKGSPFANAVKATVDVEVKYKNFGFFGRGYGLYDFNLHDSDKLGPTGRDRLGQNVTGLDGYVYGLFEPDGHNVRVRAGRQVISWGESTFIQGGINVINPVDVSKLRVPGAELKEALIPTTGIWGSLELTKAAAVEGFYLTNWDKVRIDPRGSFFSTNDVFSDDGDKVIVSFGRRHDDHVGPTNPVPPGIPGLSAAAQALYGPFDPAAEIWVPRGPDHNPKDTGQYGLKFSYLAHDFNDTEFGFYYMNYHSRTPLASATKGTTTSILTGGPLIAPICGVPALVALCATGTARAFAEYPSDIRLFGASFNTQGPAGIAFQGEYSYRPNYPLQLSTPELIMAALGLPNLITGFTQIPGAPAGATAAALVPDGTYIQGYRNVKMSQLQGTATKSFPAVMQADQLVLVGEVGMNYFHNMPDDQKFSGPGVYLPATQFGSIVGSAYSTQPGGFTTAFSWGYRLAGRLEYANLLWGGNVSPRAAWSQDISGVGPNFTEGVKSYSLGATWEYQRTWVVDVAYTSFFGGKTFCGTDAPPPGSSVTPGQSASWCSSANPLRDRDFYSITMSYSF